MKAIQVKEVGGPERMEYADVPPPEPGPKQARVKISASGVNFIDVYFRTGLYKADLPLVYGLSNVTCETQREAVALAELIGGVIDSHTSL